MATISHEAEHVVLPFADPVPVMVFSRVGPAILHYSRSLLSWRLGSATFQTLQQSLPTEFRPYYSALSDIFQLVLCDDGKPSRIHLTEYPSAQRQMPIQVILIMKALPAATSLHSLDINFIFIASKVN